MERIILHTAPSYFHRRIAVAIAVGLYALLQLRSLGEEQERVVIDDSGIRDSMLPVGTIGWEEIRGASVQRVGSVEVVALQLRDPERVIRRLPPARQFIARNALKAELPGIYLTLVGTEGEPRKIAEVISGRVASRESRVMSHES